MRVWAYFTIFTIARSPCFLTSSSLETYPPDYIEIRTIDPISSLRVFCEFSCGTKESSGIKKPFRKSGLSALQNTPELGLSDPWRRASMVAFRKSVAVTHLHRDTEVTHVAMDAHFSCRGAGGGCIRFRWDCRRLCRYRQNPVFHLLDPPLWRHF